MNRIYARRSIATGRYKACGGSQRNINLFILGMIVLATASLYFHSVAISLMPPALATETPIVRVGEWQHNGVPCDTDEDGTVCIVSETTHPAPVVVKTAPGKLFNFKGKKYSQAQLDVAKTIVKIAKEEDYAELSYLLALADCESTFNPKNINTVGNKPATSVDRGTFQFNNHHYSDVTDKCAFNLDCSTRKAIQELKKGYKSRWMCTAIVMRENRIPFYSELLKTL